MNVIRLALMALTIGSIGLVEAASSDSDVSKKTTDGSNHRYFALPKEIQLTAEQNAAFNEIKQKQGPKVIRLSNQLSDLLTNEQKAARKAAVAKAKMDGVTGKERTAAIDTAVNLTDEQKKTLAEVKPELAKLRVEIKQQIFELLTEDQQKYFKLPKTKKATTSPASKPEMPKA